jgi:transcriptional regulator with XRE-family HTH domain
MNDQDYAVPPTASSSFSERIRLLIQRVGSATEIARKCGFSEGVVRSWRDGNSDPSRARCVTLARTLGISLVWLVAGEGAIQAEAITSGSDDQTSSEARNRSGDRTDDAGDSALADIMPDVPRRDAAQRILQSGLALSGAKLSPTDHRDLLAGLYDIVGPGGEQIDAAALLAFNQRLAARVHPEPSLA